MSGRVIKAALVSFLWITSVVVTYLLASSGVPVRVSTDSRVEAEREDERIAKLAGSVAQRRAQRAVSRGDKPDAAAPDDVEAVGTAAERDLTEFRAALFGTDLVQRNAVLAREFAELTPERALELLKEFEKAPRTHHNENSFRLFAHAWAKIDGAAALKYLRENPDGYKVHDSHVWAMSGWAQSDPEAALEYAASRKMDHGLYHGVIRGWARVDLAEAETYVQGVEDDGLRRRMVSALGESYVDQRGVAGALAWATAALDGGDEGFARAVVDDILGRSMHHNPADVADWIDQHGDQANIHSWMFEHTAGNLARRDPRLAAQWLEDQLHDDRANDGRAISRVVREWAKQAPEEAVAWMENVGQSRKLNDDVFRHLAGAWSSRDPDAALEWAGGLDAARKKRAYGAIVGRMPEERIGAMTDWIQRSPADVSMDSAREAFAWRTFKKHPTTALAEASRIVNTKHREGMLVRLAHSVFRESPDAVTAWLPSSGLAPKVQEQILRGGR